MGSIGRVDLVGAGPGDPGLITVAGREALATADAVVYDALVAPRLLDLAPVDAERIFAGKRAGRATLSQDRINALLVQLARAGKHVVRLKGGDPYVFGRGAEEAAFLQAAGVPFRVVPGVTAALGVASYAGIPLTHREVASAVALVTGHIDPHDPAGALDWQSLAHFPGTVVIYMGMARLESLSRALIDGGMRAETPAAVVANGTLPTQRVIEATLRNVAAAANAASLATPAMLIVGPVTELRSVLAWYERQPLYGQSILVTRPAEELAKASDELAHLGAEVICAPLIEIIPPTDAEKSRSIIQRCSDFDWIIFTSRNGVRAFFDELYRDRDARALRAAKIAVIGPATRRMLDVYRVRADLVAETFGSEGLAEKLIPLVAERRVLLARAEQGREVLPDVLGKVCQLEQLVVYRQREVEALPEAVSDRLQEGTVDWITLTSPRAVDRLDALLPTDARHRIGQDIRLATISPLTSAAVERHGWKVAAEAREATWSALVDAIVRAVGQRR